MYPPNHLHDIYINIASEYNKSLAKHGASARGVMWSENSVQQARFEILSSIITPKENLTINDLGCGFGAFFDFLDHKKLFYGDKPCYFGYDISLKMLGELKNKYSYNPFVRPILNHELKSTADYSFASGTFNLKMANREDMWQEIIENSILNMDKFSIKGFAFNLLDQDTSSKKYLGLFYADKEHFLRFIRTNIKGNVNLVTGYTPDDFTIIVRKQ